MRLLYTFILISCFTTAIVLSALQAHSQAGSLDLTFDTDGMVTTPIGTVFDAAYAVAAQDDGKILVAGQSNNGFNYNWALVRYNVDGSLDNTFGSGGIVLTDFNGNEDYARSIRVQPDGKIIVAGQASVDVSHVNFALARYNSDGSNDNTFGTGGKVTTIVGGTISYGEAIALQSDGKILMVGTASDNGTDMDFALVRYNANGTLDNTFSSDGILITPMGATGNDYGTSVALQSNGKIVVGGYGLNLSTDFVVARFNSDGSLETTFGNGGKVFTNFANDNDLATSIAIQNDGKIVVAGKTWNGTDYDMAIARLNSDGNIDNTFDTDGKKIITGLYDNIITSVYIEPDNKILAAGYSVNNVNFDFTLFRFSTYGNFDNTFGTGGRVTTHFGSENSYANAMTLDASGKIVLAGYDDNSNDQVFAVARYTNDITGISPAAEQGAGIEFYPNPLTSFTTLKINGSYFTKANLLIYIATGQTVFCQALSPSPVGSIQQTLNLNLPPGIYFYKIDAASEVIGAGKLVVR